MARRKRVEYAGAGNGSNEHRVTWRWYVSQPHFKMGFKDAINGRGFCDEYDRMRTGQQKQYEIGRLVGAQMRLYWVNMCRIYKTKFRKPSVGGMMNSIITLCNLMKSRRELLFNDNRPD